jgi:hypothetical protein
MRPIYESAFDKQREDNVRRYIADNYACIYMKTAELAGVDGYLHYPDMNLAALVEIKCRNNSYNKYPTYMLGANKWRNGLTMAKEKNVPFMLVVSFTDGIYITKMKDNYEIKQGGRYDRGDSMDVEDCIYIPMSDFRKM